MARGKHGKALSRVLVCSFFPPGGVKVESTICRAEAARGKLMLWERGQDRFERIFNAAAQVEHWA